MGGVDVIVFDLDGTLISEEIPKKIYREAFRRSIERLRMEGFKVPENFKDYSFKNYQAILKYEDLGLIDAFKSIYTLEYNRVLEEMLNHIEMYERERAEKIYCDAIKKYNPKKVFIVTANPGAKVIIKIILPQVEENSVIIVDGDRYVEEKSRVLRELKRLGKVIYIADKEELDSEVAENAEVDFIHVNYIHD
jgi:phosphoglycolate phosphatase-like HAD superfamily hydrolase